MNRTLKALGLAFIAVVAMSAFGAATSQAVPKFTCSAYPCTATGTNTIGGEKFTTEAGSVECDSHFLVEAVRNHGEPATDLHGPATTVTVTANYTHGDGCTAFGFLGAHVTMNTCDYIFHATERVSAGVYKHHVDVNCPTGGGITIVAATCEATVGAQNGLTTVTTTNVGGSVTVQPEVTGIKMNVTKDGFGCPFSGTGEKTGTYHGDVLISRVGGGTVEVSGS